MKKYDIIYADPAWQYDSGRCLTTKSLLDGVSNEHYGTMTIDDLKKLPVSKIANENSLWKRNVVLAYNNKLTMTKKTTATDLFTCLCRSELGVRCVKEYRFHPVRKWRFDYAIPEHRVALEVEGGVWIGGRRTSPKGFLGDMEKYNTATTMGWKVLRTTPDDLCTNKTLKMLKSAIFGLNTGESVKKTDERQGVKK